MVSSTAYNWIRPSLWTAIFGGGHKEAGKSGWWLTIGNGDASSAPQATGAAIFGNSGASMGRGPRLELREGMLCPRLREAYGWKDQERGRVYLTADSLLYICL
jgi:hypothetical protein